MGGSGGQRSRRLTEVRGLRRGPMAGIRGKGRGPHFRQRLRRDDRKGLGTKDAFWKNAFAGMTMRRCQLDAKCYANISRPLGFGTSLPIKCAVSIH